MSGIAGLWRPRRGTDGAPPAAEDLPDLRKLDAGLARRGGPGRILACRADGDGCAPWLICRPFPEVERDARVPQQPAVDERGNVLVFDGRIDDRARLTHDLGAPHGTSDEMLLLAAYRRWGAAAASRVLGDFAFALWDPALRRLHLARDPSGLRPLFVRRQPHRLVWASTLRALEAVDVAGERIDERWVAGYLGGEVEPGITPWCRIGAVVPGTTVVVREDGGEEEVRGWRIGPREPIRLADDREVEERFRELFVAAVGDRMRGDGAVGVELSGGLDSSSIACVAAGLVGSTAGVGEVVTVSHVFDRSPGSDERAFIRVVEDRLGRPGHHLEESRHPMLADLEEDFFELPSPLHCTMRRERAAVAAIRAAGAATVMSGLGGDELLWSEVDMPIALADRIASRRLGGVAGLVADRARESGHSYSQVVAEALVLVGPHRWRVRYRGRPADRFPWIDRRFARRTGLGERFLGASRPGEHSLPSGREHFEMLHNVLGLTPWTYDVGPVPLDRALPYLDLRLIDFCLALPFDQFVRDGSTRSVLRRALREVLPAPILARRGKKSLDQAALRAFAARWEEVRRFLGAEPRVAAHGFVDPAALWEALERARRGRIVGTVALFQVLGLEAWLRATERPAASAGGVRASTVEAPSPDATA